MKKIAGIFLVLVVLACTKEDPKPSEEVLNYLNEILDLMEKNSINRKTIDWPIFRANAIVQLGSAQTIEDAYPAIHSAIKALKDHHTFYRKGNVSLSGFDIICNGNATSVSPIANIGYVKVETCGCSGAEAQKFAEDLQTVIRNQDNANIKGWIVDLRGNGGGNMWPMLAGISSILGDGLVGHFVNPDEIEEKWSVTAGTSWYEGQIANSVANPYRLINPNPKVAVLLDQACASSGEAVAVAFIGRPNTMSFGVATCGLATANASLTLSDGAQLLLTVSVMADRNKVKKGGSIVPDVTVNGDKEVVEKAVAWLNQ